MAWQGSFEMIAYGRMTASPKDVRARHDARLWGVWFIVCSGYLLYVLDIVGYRTLPMVCSVGLQLFVGTFLGVHCEAVPFLALAVCDSVTR